LKDNLYAGNYDSTNSAGRIINQNAFPQFNIELKKNDFLLGENVFLIVERVKSIVGIIKSNFLKSQPLEILKLEIL
jgi:hypothetical protein